MKTDNSEDQRNPSARDYEESFNKSLNTPNTPADLAAQDQRDAATRNGNASSSVANAEKQAIGDTAFGKVATTAAASANPVIGGAIKLLSKIKTRKGATTTIVIGAIIMLMILGGIFTTAIAPIAFFSNVTDDLNDQIAALDTRGQKLMRTKISAAERDASLKGCTKLSIRCKFKSLSKNQIRSFERQGITVEPGKTVLGRTFPESYKFKGQNYDPAGFADLIKTNPEARIAFKSAVNMRYLSVADGVFQRVMDRFGVSKKKPQLTGDAEERARQLADPEALKVPKDAKFIPVEGEKDVFRLEGDTKDPPTRYTQAQVDAIKATATSAPPSGVNKEMLKAFSVLGWYDMACTLKNMIGQASVGAKLARSIKLVQYVMPIASLTYAMKAGDASPEDAEAVGRFFTSPDTRGLVTDLRGTLEKAGPIDNTGQINTVAQKPNPYKGKNAMDSSLYKLSAYGGSGATTDATAQYSVGMSATSVLAAVGSTANVIGAVLNGGQGNKVCEVIQSWYVRAGGFVVGVVAMFFSGGGSVALNAGIMAAMMGGFFIVNSVLTSILKDEVVPQDITKKPEEKAAAVWTGVASLTGEASRTRAMIPANAADLVKYQTMAVQSTQDYKTIAQRQTSPFDIYSPDSATSQVASALNKYKPSSQNISSYLSSLFSLVGSTGKTLASASPAYAASTVDPNRFKQCEDQAYTDLGIDADVQCNVRYMVPEEDLAMDPDTVALYMENNNFVEPETTTGFPAGYTPPSPKESANLAVSLLNGFTNSFYDDRAALYTAPSGDYAKYLDYCVYRAFPWGKTFEESGALGSAEDEWKTGENCLLRQNDPKNPSLGTKVANFRIYTLDRNTNDASEPPSEVYSDTQSTTNPAGSDTPTLPDGTWIWPADGPITQFWGHWNASRNGAHKGIDIGVPAGTPVKVAHSGTVVASGATYHDAACGYMVTLKVDGSNPAIYENYQHLSPTGPLPSGHYNAGQLLGKVAAMSEINRGYTCSTGAHLHFQIQKVDSFVVGYSSALSLTLDPLTFLPKKP